MRKLFFATTLASALMVAMPLYAANTKPVDPKLINAGNDFGVRLLQRLASSEAGKNVFISPASISLALTMTYSGADGTTRDAMAKTLGLQGMSLAQVNGANKAFLASLNAPGKDVTLEVANSLWANENATFKQPFLSANKQSYFAEVTSLPMNAAAADRVNGWISQKTHGKIKDVLDRDAVDPSIVMFLVNAIYFKAGWVDVFEPRATQAKPFTLANGAPKNVPMMQDLRTVPYFKAPDAAVACLPYVGGRFGLWVVLPDKVDGLQSVVKQMSAASVDKWVSGAKPVEVALSLPKFKLDYFARLNDSLTALGMGVAFDQQAANFRQMCPIPPSPNIYIAFVLHKARLEVDETGTTAAAATVVAAVAMCAPIEKPEPVEFNVNHPFACFIRDNQTGAILFIGVVENPE